MAFICRRYSPTTSRCSLARTLTSHLPVEGRLTGVDGAVRGELGRYKVSADYKRFRHQERHLANSSFALGMCASIADRLVAMKAERDGVIQSSGRGLVVLKAAVVDSELERLGLKLRTVEAGPGRFISPDAYDAGGVAGGAVPLNPAIRRK